MKLLTEIDSLTPKKIVEELDKYIIGQKDAKKAVAIALRNRARRKLIPDDMKDEVAPKNIIMIGPTGIGKTEIARRLAKLCKAPFVKVEATKYTEIGYVGRDVESMVRDLMNVAVNLIKSELRDSVMDEAQRRTKEVILSYLVPDSKSNKKPFDSAEEINYDMKDTKEKFRTLFEEGKLDDRYIEISIVSNSSPVVEMFSGAGLEGMGINLTDLGNMFGGGGKEKKKKVTIKQAKKIILDQEIEKLLDMDKVTDMAVDRVENDGIIFIDEIDKIAVKSRNASGAEVSREGVQRDLLPIVEGSQVNTKYGPVRTDHILFIAAGAFHMSKPSDLIPELQGRFPIRVELKSLSKEDFIEILTKPKNALTLQYQELLKTECINITFSEDAINLIAEYAFNVNSEMENIGARRLHTIIEKLLEDISFNAPDLEEKTINITKEFVNDTLKDIVENRDLSKYIL
ncbi:MAG: HslU--HslV peptidase ATPase subunit [Spirochaetes bacterium GWD1_27_9]|nr:MAG: HslU--HslV peptidase ATPase subunit [Spirochaetes bacterium GWB1_27_13]OHD23734.1 MAG: HslU--HslV peptidase ATPase subunit [Spirochaetes bacterium GWC1_27_15]OHD42282.1 MAG: HslU--HslV peptidase ATPase subunit [Spirochaetes bacterium GWD1_27_9]